MVAQITNEAGLLDSIHDEYEQAFKQIISPKAKKVEFTFITQSNRDIISSISESYNNVLLKMLLTD